jgi:hypothetical protein
MARDVDVFGLTVGSKVSKAASLYARQNGATQREIRAATGDGDDLYNMLLRLKAKGHTVTVRDEEGRGRCYCLKHKDGILVESPSEPSIPEVWTPSRERRMQAAVRANLDEVEPGLVAIDGGREVGHRDITAEDQAGNTVVKDQAGGAVVIELKPGKAGQAAVAQLLRYSKAIQPSQKIAGLVHRNGPISTGIVAYGVPN